MSCTIAQETLERLVAFHGHACPGLTIGIRAAELAKRELGDPADIELVTAVETDMCGVDALQFLTGCTYGKGNLIHRDYGKMAFSFYDRKSGKAFRALLKPEARGDMDREMGELMAKAADGTATDEEADRLSQLRGSLQDRFMTLALEDIFAVRPIDEPAPRSAKVLESFDCEACGERTMESRTRRFGGKTLCIPCFNNVEQKV